MQSMREPDHLLHDMSLLRSDLKPRSELDHLSREVSQLRRRNIMLLQ
ncbi:MAG: hypothetical protein AB1767_09120 [Bacillota bacterium]